MIPHLYAQQWEIYHSKFSRCDDRIDRINQRYVRLIVRGKVNKTVKFESKLGVSLTKQGLARVDHLCWDGTNPG